MEIQKTHHQIFVEPPVPLAIPLETPTTLPIIPKEEIPNPSTPNLPQNFTPRRNSQHESPHFNPDQHLEVPTNSIPNPLAHVHPLTPKNEIIQEESHLSIVENNSSPNASSQISSNTSTPINATKSHFSLSPIQITNFTSSHALSPQNFENGKNDLLTSQSKLYKPSNSPAPGIREPSNQHPNKGPSLPILHENHQNPPSSLIFAESQPVNSPNY
ncbi:hypothetical protein O181_010433 [Austropuccinia psidii MF-1]|uniref:Uncharacterized protein n=1 Tax=Austropuccinia psidii MF-1 TaxID=1389203 RepID=A0A9Q3BT00_9BASI|nr:hypothetical protein [Austropuccinia psidii MF-1]